MHEVRRMPEEKSAKAWKKYGGEKITHDKKYKLEKREGGKVARKQFEKRRAFYFHVTDLFFFTTEDKEKRKREKEPVLRPATTTALG